jgi:hypothetical protein
MSTQKMEKVFPLAYRPYETVPPYMGAPLFSVKGLVVLKRNIESLLADRKENQVQLAIACGHRKSWINKFIKDDTMKVEIQLRDLDKIANFFGIEVHQLFQPGIGRLTERRAGGDRRQNVERRIGHQGRQFAELRSEHAKLPRLPHAASASRESLPEPLRRTVAKLDREIEQEIAAYYAREQTATDGAHRADLSKDHRRIRRPRAESGG